MMRTGPAQVPAETAKAIDNGWLHSGDLAARDDDDYVTIKGRIKDIAIFSGVNISLRQIETELMRIEGIADCACTFARGL